MQTGTYRIHLGSNGTKVGGREGSWHDPRINMVIISVFFFLFYFTSSPLPYFVSSSFGLWADLLPSVGLATNSTSCIARGFYLVSTHTRSEHIRYKESGTSRLPAGTHPFHGIAASRKDSTAIHLFMSGSGFPPPSPGFLFHLPGLVVFPPHL